MKTAYVRLALGVFVACILSVDHQSQPSGNGKVEEKVTESTSGKKHKKTIERILDKVLISSREEVDVDGDGQLDYIFEKLFRDGRQSFASTSYVKDRRTIRGYYANATLLSQEGDEDGDGFFETILFFNTHGLPVEAFVRTKDGNVTQFSKEKLGDLQRSFSLVSTRSIHVARLIFATA